MIGFNFINLFDLSVGEENSTKVLENVSSNISFKGSNLWVLACAILIASVGLNVNSTAVIIGAMLISPLMGPIVGAGFALGIYDFELLKKSLINLGIATLASLIVSYLYFYLSPFKVAQSELLARTSPNIYDILIAFFGGLVGVITITRVEKGNPLPGVAIATALMPPLCTAGFGLATSNFKYFFGALFLYTINCVFICLATFIIVKKLNYPPVNFVNKKLKKQIQLTISALTLMLIIPSLYFAFKLYHEQTFKLSAEKFIENEFHDKKIIYLKTNFGTNKKTIEVAFLDYKPDSLMVKKHYTNLIAFGLEKTVLKFIEKPNILEKQDNQIDQLIAEKNELINQLENQIENKKYDNTILLKELKPFYPEIKSIILVKTKIANDTLSTENILFYYDSNKKINPKELDKIKNFLSAKFENHRIVISTTPIN